MKLFLWQVKSIVIENRNTKTVTQTESPYNIEENRNISSIKSNVLATVQSNKYKSGNINIVEYNTDLLENFH